MRVLNLGLRPKPGTFHYPVIRTQFLGSVESALLLWPQFTHVIFTSQSTVEYWPGPWDKPTLAIGAATAAALQKRGLNPLLASEATQEGVVELVKGIEGYFFLPHSKRARPVLTEYFEQHRIPFLALDLYDTVFQKLEPVPNLDDFDEILFTSPSTLEGFLRIYGKLPTDKKLTPIGPVTDREVRKEMGRSAEIQTQK